MSAACSNRESAFDLSILKQEHHRDSENGGGEPASSRMGVGYQLTRQLYASSAADSHLPHSLVRVTIQVLYMGLPYPQA